MKPVACRPSQDLVQRVFGAASVRLIVGSSATWIRVDGASYTSKLAGSALWPARYRPRRAALDIGDCYRQLRFQEVYCVNTTTV